MSSENERRADYGERALRAGSPDFGDHGLDQEDVLTEVSDTIANLLHTCDRYEVDWNEAWSRGHSAYVGDHADGGPPPKNRDAYGYRQFGVQQQKEALALLESLTWGDMDMAIWDLENELRRSIEATRFYFLKWEAEAEAVGLPDELSLSAEVVEDLSPEWRLAYVARLLRSLAMSYGVSTDHRGDRMPVWDEHKDSPAGLLRGLNDLLWLGTLGDGNSESDRRERETQDDP
jgi:hypothetical protein